MSGPLPVAEDDGTTRAAGSAVAVERAVDVLVHLARERDATVSELARDVGAGSSAIHRILTALRRKGLVDQDPQTDRYSLTWGILALARPVRGEADVREVAREHMRHMRELTGETVALHVRSRFERLCVDQLESQQEVRWVGLVGQWSPLVVGASGLAILAALPDDEVESYLSTIAIHAPEGGRVDRDRLRERLAEIRRQGYARTDGDRIDGLAGLSAPIFDGSGLAIGAITVAGPSHRMPADLGTWSSELRGAAANISALLGYEGEPFGEAPAAT